MIVAPVVDGRSRPTDRPGDLRNLLAAVDQTRFRPDFAIRPYATGRLLSRCESWKVRGMVGKLAR